MDITKYLKAWLLATILCAIAANASADEVLWYGGDTDFASGLTSGYGFGGDSNVYDDFEVGTGGVTVTGLFGDFLVLAGHDSVDQVEYEIRSGMSSGNGGAIIAMGTASASQEYRGQWNQLNYYRITTVDLDVSLTSGEYWMSLAPISDRHVTVVTTSGVNGIGSPLGNGNAFWNAPWFGAHFVPVEEVLGGHRNWDFSYGIIGTPVPAPGAILVLLPGLLFGRRRASRH